jgi:hypothetical protein
MGTNMQAMKRSKITAYVALHAEKTDLGRWYHKDFGPKLTNVQRSYEIALKNGNAFVVVCSSQSKAKRNYPYF